MNDWICGQARRDSTASLLVEADEEAVERLAKMPAASSMPSAASGL
jgi:hypothetical protein